MDLYDPCATVHPYVSGEMIGKLQITYNRTRQAVITTELIEIISGSVALESKD